MKRVLGLVLLFIPLCLQAGWQTASSDLFPVLHEGRYRPAEAYAQRWTEEQFGTLSLPDETSAQDLVWGLHFYGHGPFRALPLFQVDHPQLKTLLNLPAAESIFTFEQLHERLITQAATSRAVLSRIAAHHYFEQFFSPNNRGRATKQELSQLAAGLWVDLKGDQLVVTGTSTFSPWDVLTEGTIIQETVAHSTPAILKQEKPLVDQALTLLAHVQDFESLEAPTHRSDLAEALSDYQEEGKKPADIAMLLERDFPLQSRLASAQKLLLALPTKASPDAWVSLRTLALQQYHPETDALGPIENFTPYPDFIFSAIRATYLELDKEYRSDLNSSIQEERIASLLDQLGHYLIQGYETIADTPVKTTSTKQLNYPSMLQIWVESILYSYPLIPVLTLLYGLSILAFLSNWISRKQEDSGLGLFTLNFAWLLHTLVLGMRCFVLQRPPVSNMEETVLYVPWVSVLCGILLYRMVKNQVLPFASALIAFALTGVMLKTGLNQSMENVQAVLDSQYWLLVHVLMVVGSYGIYFLAGALGHLYLLLRDKESGLARGVSNGILQAMYLGTALLIPGTILGGVWAAESWGRFWDWDPKESWAFISSGIYLLWIHAYHFGLIRSTGLAVGSILGLMAVSFTWYGVNYILGTGLHSYGFGHGGETWYYAYLTGELLFLTFIFIPKRKALTP